MLNKHLRGEAYEGKDSLVNSIQNNLTRRKFLTQLVAGAGTLIFAPHILAQSLQERNEALKLKQAQGLEWYLPNKKELGENITLDPNDGLPNPFNVPYERLRDPKGFNADNTGLKEMIVAGYNFGRKSPRYPDLLFIVRGFDSKKSAINFTQEEVKKSKKKSYNLITNNKSINLGVSEINSFAQLEYFFDFFKRYSNRVEISEIVNKNGEIKSVKNLYNQIDSIKKLVKKGYSINKIKRKDFDLAPLSFR